VDVFVEVIGWSGALIVLAAYLLAARDVWPASGVRSAVANMLGAALLTVNAWRHGAFPSASLNIVWIAIALATLARGLGSSPPARRSPHPG
jgi:hypothetical protein